MTSTMTSVATLHGIDKFYGSSHVLKGVDLSIERGEIVSLVGRSGSGKSTILRVLAGLSTDHTGERHVAGHPAVAFQEPRLFPWRSVRQNVSYGLNTAGVTGNEALTAADATLAEVGLAEKRDAWPLTLSGGQAQRAALARALVGEPELLLLDEPFGALDALTRLTMQSLLLDLWGRHRFGILLVTHDVDEAIALADRVVVLENGAVSDTVTVDRPNNPRPLQLSTRGADCRKSKISARVGGG